MSRPDWCPQDVWEAAGPDASDSLPHLDVVGSPYATIADFDFAVRTHASRAILAERERCRGVANERAAQLWAGIQLPISDEAKAGWAGQMIEALQIEQRIADGRVPVDSINIEGLHKAATEAGFRQ